MLFWTSSMKSICGFCWILTQNSCYHQNRQEQISSCYFILNSETNESCIICVATINPYKRLSMSGCLLFSQLHIEYPNIQYCTILYLIPKPIIFKEYPSPNCYFPMFDILKSLYVWLQFTLAKKPRKNVKYPTKDAYKDEISLYLYYSILCIHNKSEMRNIFNYF